MNMSPRARKFALTAHVTTSVGWLGAAAAYLVLAVGLLVGQDAETVHGAVSLMNLIAWYGIVPLSLAAFLTGVVSSLGTPWGLVRYYWVLIKILLNGVAIVVLLRYATTLGQVASAAAAASQSGAPLAMLHSPSHAVHAGGGLLVLLVATVLSMYKPQGMTRYGRRRQWERLHASRRAAPVTTPAPIHQSGVH